MRSDNPFTRPAPLVAVPQRDLRLAVVPGDVPNAGEGSAVAERAVGAPLVVVADPVWQRGATGLA